MIMRNLLIMLSLCIITYACNQKKGDKESSNGKDTVTMAPLKQEVMLIHDDAMLKMGEVRKLQKQLLTMADSNGTDSVMAQKYRDLANSLELANESMMDWMRAYDPNFDGREDAVKEYLTQQKKAIEEVNQRMDSTLQEGRKALD